MKSQSLEKQRLPDSPGVYFFKKGGNILYIGKATSLRDRVKSYFAADLIETRGMFIADMLLKANKVDYLKTDSVLEALILEANLIKKYQPRYNTKEKDNKSFNYIVITKEDFPRVLTIRGRNLTQKPKTLNFKPDTYFGPFTNGNQLKEAIKIIRKIFPFRDKCRMDQDRPCFNYQIGLCPGMCGGLVSKVDYAKTIKNIKLFFTGKKKQIIKNLEKQMKIFARIGEYEKANLTKRQIFALGHIQDVALLKSNDSELIGVKSEDSFRIEAYDAAHLSGTNNVGVMVVMENGELKKSDYRKFKIQDSKGDDVGALREMLERRLNHSEWPLPNLIVLDGGIAQLNASKETINKKYQGFTLILLVAVTKDEKHQPKALIGDETMIKKYKKEILLINNEAHRFAVAFHRERRSAII